MISQEIKKYLNNLTLDDFFHHSVGSDLEKALSLYEKFQKSISTLGDKQEENRNTRLKILTVMNFSILKKLGEGKRLEEFDQQDWKEIAAASGHAIIREETQYVISVFRMYEECIRASADYVENFTSEKRVAEIRLLADEIIEKTYLLKDEQISEVAYIEQCLWIALEAMIKLIATFASRVLVNEYADLSCALASYAFEYGRMILYQRERELINEIIQSQYVLDSELQIKYDRFIEELAEQSDRFLILVDNAFAPGFRKQFLGSIDLAESIGVPEEEILNSLDEIDSFFVD